MSLTRIEKIATMHVPGLADGETVSAGDFVRIRPVHIMTHDNTSAVMGKFNSIGAESIHDPKQPIFAIDHDIQNHSPENLGKYAKIESFAKAHGVRFYPAGTGISHQVMIERGHVTPGAMVVGSDSHSNIYGAIAALGTPVVRTDAASIWAIGETWWQVPQIAKVTLTGSLRPGVTGKDVIIALCGAFNQDEVLNHAVEFQGEGITCLSMDQRMAIANMTTEWGAMAGVFPFDLVLKDWLTKRAMWLASRRTPTYTPEDVEQWYQHRLEADPDAHYAVELELDLNSVIPHVSGPDHVKIMHALPKIEAEHVEIQKAYLLSCVNGRLEDLRAAADVLRDKTVADGVTFYVAAASSVIQADAEADGTWSTLENAGAHFLPPGCGTCIGLGEGTLEPGETGISATNRNFKGRMGSRDAKAYLASPAVVAASAAAGYICSPDRFDIVKPKTKTTINGPRRSTGDGVSIIDGFQRKVAGRVLWLGVDNMNTDGIYAGAMTYRDDVTEAQMADAAMANYDPSFVGIAQAGDIIVSGENFGTGSSREQAATCLKVRGIACVVAASFSQTYVRNAINNGFICLTCPDLVAHLRATLHDDAPTVPSGRLDIDFERATMSFDGQTFGFTPLGEVPQGIIVAGGAEAVVRRRLAGD
jgi:homoaconitate hydratase